MSLLIIGVASKNKLQQFEYASACLEDVDDESSSSEDFKPYDRQGDVSFTCLLFNSFFFLFKTFELCIRN